MKKVSANQFEDPVLIEIVSALKKEFNPSRLFLFGSHATGTATQDSDYDFVVVVSDNTKSRSANMDRAAKVLMHIPKHADVFVYSDTEFNEWKNESSSIPETALNSGKEIDLG